MPRKQFVADLQKARTDIKPPGVRNIKAGEDDGQFDFEFALHDAASTIVHISAIVPDVSEYPRSHQYMIFCGEAAPAYIAKSLQNVPNTNGKTVFELADIISTHLTLRTADSDGDTPMHDSQSEDEMHDEDDDADDVYDDSDEAFDFGDPAPPTIRGLNDSTHGSNPNFKSDKAFRDRLRSDLRTTKDAGFKVGFLGSLLEGQSGFVAVSIRMRKLGISEEAMQAWKVDPSEYLILLIHYPNGYKTTEELQACENIRMQQNLGARVCASKKYKPSLQEAINLFTKARNDRSSTANVSEIISADNTDLNPVHDTFISKPLMAMLEKNLVPILRFRSTGMGWLGAEMWFEKCQGAGSMENLDAVPDTYYQPEDVRKALPAIMQRDHYLQQDVTQFSFPLLAMQFTLRHFARCTEFCLVCHGKLDSDLEAIKPYVCEQPLCLYQYMTLGFGPSIEHEIQFQPCVVDLLVSFCYNSASQSKLKDFPDGLSITVPPLDLRVAASDDLWYAKSPAAETVRDPISGQDVVIYAVEFDQERRELHFTNKPEGGCPVSRGQWIVMNYRATSVGEEEQELHCRISQTNMYPFIVIDEPIVRTSSTSSQFPDMERSALPDTVKEKRLTTNEKKPTTPAPTPRWKRVTFTTYALDFKILSDESKRQTICKLLDTLPTVTQMQHYLKTNHLNDLKDWVERLSPAATSLLRWIIASNRSCIMQVDNGLKDSSKDSGAPQAERLYGMEGWMQFRFAMGAPDKQARFLSAVRQTTGRLSLTYPTIFAWHGSPLHNWHSIIREGLHFKDTTNGRAYGHGVYHAKDASTSTGYSLLRPAGNTWPQSVLRISSALALNEIVNAPTEFVSSSPYYVVNQLDWIQTRYLFVKCTPTSEDFNLGAETKPAKVHPQDPSHIPSGPSGHLITIPASAIKTGTVHQKSGAHEKRPSSWNGTASKRLKDGSGTSMNTAILIEDDDASVETNDEDLAALLSEDEADSTPGDDVRAEGVSSNGAAAMGTFTSTLDFSTLPMMPDPTYATMATTKRLNSELRALNKVQSTTDPSDLGWFINFDKIDNVYQWIVELHSFHTFTVRDKPLPLVADMKKAGANSVVLEIRFGPDFPFSPPYIRVIRPRFLPFTQGGGGHIVIGGAICMELLTNTGWSGIMSMESVLMQVRMAIASEPFARLESKGHPYAGSGHDYGTGEAADGYIRACQSHGWQVPPGFKQIAHGMTPASEDSAADGAQV